MGQIVGYLSLHCSKSFQDDNDAEFEFGVHPDYEGKGRGTALVEKAIVFAENETKLCQLIAKVAKNSLKSERMLTSKLGFSESKRDNLGCILVKNINR